MLHSRVARFRSLSKKAVMAAPQMIIHPSQSVHALRGVHWATLNMLDVQWIRDYGIKTILDVGANTGQFASACRVVFPIAEIYSFEPLPDCYRSLTRKMMGIPGFHSFNVAIGEVAGTASIHRSSFSESSSLLEMTTDHKEAFPWTAQSSELVVQVRPLDSFIDQIDLIPNVLLKIDVQGYEERVLRGATDILANTSLVVMEVSFAALYEGEADFQSVDDTMKVNGFGFAGMLDQLLHPQTGRILQGDAIYIKNGG